MIEVECKRGNESITSSFWHIRWTIWKI